MDNKKLKELMWTKKPNGFTPLDVWKEAKKDLVEKLLSKLKKQGFHDIIRYDGCGKTHTHKADEVLRRLIDSDK